MQQNLIFVHPNRLLLQDCGMFTRLAFLCVVRNCTQKCNRSMWWYSIQITEINWWICESAQLVCLSNYSFVVVLFVKLLQYFKACRAFVHPSRTWICQRFCAETENGHLHWLWLFAVWLKHTHFGCWKLCICWEGIELPENSLLFQKDGWNCSGVGCSLSRWGFLLLLRWRRKKSSP